jgi:hypothetical protein
VTGSETGRNAGLHERPYLDPWPRCPRCGATAEVSWDEVLFDGPEQRRMYMVTAMSCPRNCMIVDGAS